MKKLLLSSLLFIVSLFTAMAQKSELKFNLKKGAKSVKIIARLSKVGAVAKVDFEKGESLQINQTQEELITFNYTFKQVLEEERVMTINAEHLEVLRLASTPAINGIVSLASESLKKLNLDYTPLTKSPYIDFSQCPNIEEITLNSCDVEELDLPKNPKIKSLQVSPALMSKKALKRVDLSKLKHLEDISLQGTVLEEIDLRACPNLKQLSIAGLDHNHYPKRALGLKAMQKLDLVNISKCGFSYDMLPDRNNTDIERFKIWNMYNAFVPEERIDGLVVDLSYLKQQKGVSATKNTTKFRWVRYDYQTKKYLDLPVDKITEDSGVFTFDKSILGDAKELKVRCMLDNAGYNTLQGFPAWKTGYKTETITLREITEKSEVEKKKDEKPTAIDELGLQETQVQLVGLKLFVFNPRLAQESYAIYNLSGQLISRGLVSVDGSINLELPYRGVFVLKIGNQILKLQI